MASLHTPRQRGLQRPSYGPGSSPHYGASTTANRKESLRALSGQAEPRTPAGNMDADLEVGDHVNVPGDMYGVVKFIGNVKGKSGRFVGVELDREFASKGKNSGDVDGINYFATSISGAGIFLPVHRAEKRVSPSVSLDSFPATPYTPSYSTTYGQRTKPSDNYTPPTPALPHKFSQTVGPGARPPSPSFKPKRPSLPRPESPLRNKVPNLAPTPAATRALSQSVRGTRPGVTPSKSSFKTSTTTRPGTGGQTSRPYSRTGSRLGNRDDDVGVGVAATTNGRTTSNGSVPSFSQPLRSPSRLGSAGGQEQELQRLKQQLSERDRRLEEQAASLAEMEASVRELSAILPPDGVPSHGRTGSYGDEDDRTAAQLRQALREKNEKISMLTAEFDAHRADFRSTLDSLEMASTETERVYEEQKRDLLAQLAELQEMSQSKEDFEGVARQLKQLEDLVAELEEGLEESRRGEAEARGEVEFLRGEVERGRSELRREREKAAAAVKTADPRSALAREMEQKDDEIRGLKAIIHNLSSGSSEPVAESPILTDDHGRNESGHIATAAHGQRESVRTATALDSSSSLAHHSRSSTVKATFSEHAARRSGVGLNPEDASLLEDDIHHETAASVGTSGPTAMYCDMCESSTHDTIECSTLQGSGAAAENGRKQINGEESGREETPQVPYSPGKENETGVKAFGKGGNEDKWCALCEKEGHLAFDCPEEQY